MGAPFLSGIPSPLIVVGDLFVDGNTTLGDVVQANYANGEPFINGDSTLFYPNGTPLADSTGSIYYTNGGQIINGMEGAIFYSNNNVLADSSGALYYGGAGNPVLIDSSSDLYYANGGLLATSDGTLFYGDESVLATSAGDFCSNLPFGSLMKSGGPGSVTVAAVVGTDFSKNFVQRVAYTGGATATANITTVNGVNILALLNGSTSSTALTVNLPAGSFDGQTLDISFNQAATAITYGGHTVIGGLTAAVIGSRQRLVWDNTLSEWR